MKCKHTFKKHYSQTERILIEEEIESYPLCGYSLDREFIQWRHTYLATHSLFVGVLKHGEAVFYVNGSYTFQCPSMTPQTGAVIWRWLMEAWADIVKHLKPGYLIYCNVEKSDGLGERRRRMFAKLGFTQNSERADYLRLTVPSLAS